MNFSTYQELAHKTAEYPHIAVVLDPKDPQDDTFQLTTAGFLYPALGLAGEAGEVAEKIKKLVRNKGGEYDREDVRMIEKELGDVLWYIAELCTVFGIDMSECAKMNIVKLEDRDKRGVIKSQGDDR